MKRKTKERKKLKEKTNLKVKNQNYQTLTQIGTVKRKII